MKNIIVRRIWLHLVCIFKFKLRTAYRANKHGDIHEILYCAWQTTGNMENDKQLEQRPGNRSFLTYHCAWYGEWILLGPHRIAMGSKWAGSRSWQPQKDFWQMLPLMALYTNRTDYTQPLLNEREISSLKTGLVIYALKVVHSKIFSMTARENDLCTPHQKWYQKLSCYLFYLLSNINWDVSSMFTAVFL